MVESIGIIGAGITGLAAAYVLSTKYDVTIVARDQPGDLGLDWASPWAGAVFHPQRHADESQQKMQRDSVGLPIVAFTYLWMTHTELPSPASFYTHEYNKHIRTYQQKVCPVLSIPPVNPSLYYSYRVIPTDSFKFYWDIANQDPSNGVKSYPMKEYFDDETKASDLWYRCLMPDYQVMLSSELPSEIRLGTTYTTLAINPLSFLPWLKDKLVERGVKFLRAEVKSFAEARSLTKSRVIVNASGVGARVLAGDEAVVPVRGQTMFMKTDFSQLVMLEGTEYTYVIPRAGSGGVIVGGIKSDRLDAEVDIPLKSDILRRVNRLTKGAFEGIDLGAVTDVLGFRPGRKGGLRIEREDDVIHAYGVEGAGYIYSFGVAEKVKQLLEDSQMKPRL